MFGWLFDSAIKRGVEKAVDDFLASDRLAKMIDEVILNAIREIANDRPLTFVGFINKIAITLFDAANGSMTYDEAKKLAMQTYEDFTASERVKFGHPDYDWTGAGAQTLARELCIEYWD